MLEFIILSSVDDHYVFSLYFWLDFVATLSMIPEISYLSSWLVEPAGLAHGSESHSLSAAARAVRRSCKQFVWYKLLYAYSALVSLVAQVTRVLKLLRLFRLLRIVKLLKCFNTRTPQLLDPGEFYLSYPSFSNSGTCHCFAGSWHNPFVKNGHHRHQHSGPEHELARAPSIFSAQPEVQPMQARKGMGFDDATAAAAGDAGRAYSNAAHRVAEVGEQIARSMSLKVSSHFPHRRGNSTHVLLFLIVSKVILGVMVLVLALPAVEYEEIDYTPELGLEQLESLSNASWPGTSRIISYNTFMDFHPKTLYLAVGTELFLNLPTGHLRDIEMLELSSRSGQSTVTLDVRDQIYTEAAYSVAREAIVLLVLLIQSGLLIRTVRIGLVRPLEHIVEYVSRYINMDKLRSAYGMHTSCY